MAARRNRDTSAKLDAVTEQVSNGHKSNLREDIDRIADGQAEILAGLGRQDAVLLEHGRALNGLRDDIAQERRERADLAERVNTHIDGEVGR